MKKVIIFLSAAILAFGLFASCSTDIEESGDLSEIQIQRPAN